MADLTEDEARGAQHKMKALEDALLSVVIGQHAAVRELCIGLFADGHVLLEGVPGVAKTLLARTLAAALELKFHRVQFTPDLMPADLIGTRIWNPEAREWELHQGPVFCDVLLADEVNRTPPKTQAALLEAMEERQAPSTVNVRILVRRFSSWRRKTRSNSKAHIRCRKRRRIASC
jgi:MoxR-like ATPase